MVRKSIWIYYLYFKQFLLSRLAYKGDFIASLISGLLVAVAGLLFIVFLLGGESVSSLGTWSRDEVLFIYGFSLLPTAIFSTFSPNLYLFGDRYIIQGQFDRVLLRPLNSLAQVIFETFSLESIGSLLTGLGLIYYTTDSLGITLGVFDWLWLFVAAVSGGVILLSFFIFLASFSFHFEDRIGITPPFYNLMQFSRYPLTIFNGVIQFILSWVVPFGFVAFFPSTHFFEREGFAAYCYVTPLVAIVVAYVAITSWKIGVSNYTSTGN